MPSCERGKCGSVAVHALSRLISEKTESHCLCVTHMVSGQRLLGHRTTHNGMLWKTTQGINKISTIAFSLGQRRHPQLAALGSVYGDKIRGSRFDIEQL